MPLRWAPLTLALSLWAQAPANLPDKVADYRAFLAAQDAFDHGDAKKAVDSLAPVWKIDPVSPLLGKAAILATKSYQQLGQYADALQTLRDYAERLPQPEGLTLLARNAEAAGDNAGAAGYYQRVYYDYPTSQDAEDAAIALERLHGILKENFPPVMPQVRLERAAKLTRAGQGAKARREYAQIALESGGLERDLAKVRAVSDSFSALESLRVSSPIADAERLYLLHEAARRGQLKESAKASLDELGRKYPKSNWHLKTLISEANGHLVANEPDEYEPLYRACYEQFPNEPDAAFCHWKVAWTSYVRREGKAMLEEHLRLFPDSDKTSAAMYFLGRHSELVSRYPLSYYSTLVREKRPAKKTVPLDFQPSPMMRVRLDRARLLENAGIPEWAEFELQYAAQNETNSFPAALALAETASRRGAHDVSIRYIKRFAPGYLGIPLEAAPDRFWKLAFPIPYRVSLETESRQRGLDPYIVAALIRQESEFNPKAVSSARAYGLTQVLPSTGRQLSRRVGIAQFTPAMLFQPEVNLKLGAYYLKTLLDQQNGSWEQTLASYNAGKRRADTWASWASYREPAEYIESIPFTETRNYIQIVLRNAWVYRKLYGSSER